MRPVLLISLPSQSQSPPRRYSRAALSHKSDPPEFTILRYGLSALICTISTLESFPLIPPTLCTSQTHTASADHNHVPFEFGAGDVLTAHRYIYPIPCAHSSLPFSHSVCAIAIRPHPHFDQVQRRYMNRSNTTLTSPIPSSCTLDPCESILSPHTCLITLVCANRRNPK